MSRTGGQVDLKLTEQNEEDAPLRPAALEVFSSAEFYSPGEVCQKLKISRWTLRRRVNDGTLPKPLAFKGIGPRFKGAELKQCVDQAPRPWREISKAG